MPYVCPVCCYKNLPYPPQDYEICPSCGTEFEYHDALRSHEELREMWVGKRAPWHSRVITPPIDWNPWLQLIIGGHPEALPFKANVKIEANIILGEPIKAGNGWILKAEAYA
jgi:hypothetical protein